MFAVTMTANSNALTNPNLVNKLNSEKKEAFGEGKEYTILNVLSVRKSRSAVENLPGRASKDTGRSREIYKQTKKKTLPPLSLSASVFLSARWRAHFPPLFLWISFPKCSICDSICTLQSSPVQEQQPQHDSRNTVKQALPFPCDCFSNAFSESFPVAIF